MRKFKLFPFLILATACAGSEAPDGQDSLADFDTAVPVTGQALQANVVSAERVDLQWGAATDSISSSGNLYYKVVKAAQANFLHSVEHANATPPRNVIMNWTKNVTSVPVTGLEGGVNYAFAIIVRDQAGNQNLYQPVSVTTPRAVFHMYKMASHTGGDFNGISGADELCQNHPSRPTSSTYKALLVDGVERVACTSPDCSVGGADEHVNWALRPNADYIRADGTPVASTNSVGLFELPATNSIDTSGDMWTGLESDWTSSSNNCNNWGSMSLTGMQGSLVQTDLRLVSTSAISCSSAAALICVEQPQ